MKISRPGFGYASRDEGLPWGAKTEQRSKYGGAVDQLGLAPKRGKLPAWIASRVVLTHKTTGDKLRKIAVGVLPPGLLSREEAGDLAKRLFELAQEVRAWQASDEGKRWNQLDVGHASVALPWQWFVGPVDGPSGQHKVAITVAEPGILTAAEADAVAQKLLDVARALPSSA